MACIIFELLTGCNLFDLSEDDSSDEDDLINDDDSSDNSDDSDEEENDSSDDSDDEEDLEADFEHLVQIVELLGDFPKSYKKSDYWQDFFNKQMKLKGNPKINRRSISNVLIKDQHFDPKDAKEIEDFLKPMLHYSPTLRATAEQCLSHSWLKLD